MPSDSQQWPKYYPLGCPPANASSIEVTVYRAVKNDPPQSKDFVPYKILKPDYDFGEEECKACGLSVYQNVDELTQLCKVLPALKKCKYIAVGTIAKNSGLIMNTPYNNTKGSHMTWWPYSHVSPAALFRVCTEDKK